MKTILKISLLCLLAFVAVVALVCVPNDTLPPETWVAAFFGSKIIAVGAWYAEYRLLNYMAATGQLSEMDILADQ